MNIVDNRRKPWPACPQLQQLPELFSFFEKTINSSIWRQCCCEEREARAIESRLNNLAILLQVQKIYAKQFWGRNEMKIQASFVHFFIMLKQLFLSILPQNFNTINLAQESNMLCLELPQIEKIVNYFLNKLKSVHAFMHQTHFQEESTLINEFFKDIIDFCHQLPEMGREKLVEIPKIMRYICLSNPIDSLKVHDPDRLRKKSNTIQMKERNEMMKVRKGSDCTSDINSNSTYKKSVLINKSERVSVSSRGTEIRQDFSKLFRFPTKIYGSEDKSNDMSQTITSIAHTRKDSLLESIRIQRNRSTTISPQGFSRLRGLKRSTLQRKISNVSTSFLSPSREKGLDSSLGKILFRLQKHEDMQLQRKNLKQSKRPALRHQSYFSSSALFEPTSGKPKGWALIRQYIARKVVERRMKKLLFS